MFARLEFDPAGGRRSADFDALSQARTDHLFDQCQAETILAIAKEPGVSEFDNPFGNPEFDRRWDGPGERRRGIPSLSGRQRLLPGETIEPDPLQPFRHAISDHGEALSEPLKSWQDLQSSIDDPSVRPSTCLNLTIGEKGLENSIPVIESSAEPWLDLTVFGTNRVRDSKERQS
jgi:hypothetical protein